MTDIGCTICQEGFCNRKKVCSLPCGHLLHSQCRDNWDQTGKGHCPVCKKPFDCFYAIGLTVVKNGPVADMMRKVDSLEAQLRNQPFGPSADMAKLQSTLNTLMSHVMAKDETIKMLDAELLKMRHSRTEADSMEAKLCALEERYQAKLKQAEERTRAAEYKAKAAEEALIKECGLFQLKLSEELREHQKTLDEQSTRIQELTDRYLEVLTANEAKIQELELKTVVLERKAEEQEEEEALNFSGSKILGMTDEKLKSKMLKMEAQNRSLEKQLLHQSNLTKTEAIKYEANSKLISALENSLQAANERLSFYEGFLVKKVATQISEIRESIGMALAEDEEETNINHTPQSDLDQGKGRQ